MPEILRRSLYSELLQQLVDALNERSADALCKRLQPAFCDLRRAYRRRSVAVDYANPDCAAAYMLGYYPNYAAQIREVLTSLPLEALARVALIGAGPAPEALGIASLVEDSGRGDRVQVVGVEYSAAWDAMRDITVKLCRSLAPSVAVSQAITRANFRDPLEPDIAGMLSAQNAIICQNALNELGSAPFFMRNIDEIARRLRPGSYLVFSDQIGYNTTGIMARIRNGVLPLGFSVVHDPEYEWLITPRYSMPESVTRAFFDRTITETDDRGEVFSLTARLYLRVRALILRCERN